MSMTQKILLAVDGSAVAERAARHLLGLAAAGLALRAVVVNVQPPVSGDIVTFIDTQTIADYHREQSEQAAAAVMEILSAGGVEAAVDHAVGYAAEAIVRRAGKHDVDQIVMGSRGLNALSSIVLGSVANKVIHLADVPVTLVK